MINEMYYSLSEAKADCLRMDCAGIMGYDEGWLVVVRYEGTSGGF